MTAKEFIDKSKQIISEEFSPTTLGIAPEDIEMMWYSCLGGNYTALFYVPSSPTPPDYFEATYILDDNQLSIDAYIREAHCDTAWR